MFIIARWIINALVLLAITYLLPGFTVASFGWALIVALFLGIVNAIIRPILLILTLPITILTLGVFALVINALMILLVSFLLAGFQVDTFTTAFIAALILWVASWFTNAIVRSSREHSHATWRKPPSQPGQPPIIEG